MGPTPSAADMLHEALIGPRSALTPLPDTQVISRPGWYQVRTPSLRQGGLNEVVCSILPAGDADAIIDATVGEYRRLGIKFRWSVPPGPGADELAARLAQRGLRQEGARAMWRRTEAVVSRPELPEVSVASTDAFTEVMARGWKVDPAPMHALHCAMAADPKRRYRFHVARVDGREVGAAASLLLERSAYLLGAVVVEEARGKGAYRALVEARLREAFAEHREVATSLAREATSAPILEHLGFETAASIAVFRG